MQSGECDSSVYGDSFGSSAVIQGDWLLLPVVGVSVGGAVDFVLAWLGGPLALAPAAAAAVLEAAVGTEVSSDGISGSGGPGLATVGLGVGPISRLNSLGRSVVFEVPSLSPVPGGCARPRS